VRRGNRAAKQKQLGSLGFFADCAIIYLDNGGEWREEFWMLLKRVADFTCTHWPEKDSGVWELAEEAHYVASRVMSWVVLDRAISIADRTGHSGETDHWKETAAAIHAEVMDKGWCEKKQTFRQRYGSDHPRVTATLDALERELVVDGLIHRFDPAQTLGGKQLPIGEFEGAFLPCVFWHAHALAKAGRCDEAESILKKCEAISGDIGLFAEEADPRRGIFLGNTPLLFSHVEYARAAMELDEARTRAVRQTESSNL
jgi:GH15 family glucan-1,4-alpha-glucosidase